MEPDSRLLDVGIGTATALVRNQELVASRRVVVVGIDPEREYVTKAARVVAAAGLSDAVKVHCLSIYQPGLRSAFAGKAKFDHAYFSGSLTLMPDPPAALRCAATIPMRSTATRARMSLWTCLIVRGSSAYFQRRRRMRFGNGWTRAR